jgi:transcriptional regulator with XRE-family HTH domain
VTIGAQLRAAREAARPTQAELAARAHVTGPKPARGITPGELGARYDRARGAAPGTTPKRAVLRWESGGRVPTPEARRMLERALGLPKGALDGEVHCGLPAKRCWSDRRSCECTCMPCALSR